MVSGVPTWVDKQDIALGVPQPGDAETKRPSTPCLMASKGRVCVHGCAYVNRCQLHAHFISKNHFQEMNLGDSGCSWLTYLSIMIDLRIRVNEYPIQ